MVIADQDEHDNGSKAAALDKPRADVDVKLVPESGDEDAADVDVAVAVAADMALTGV